MQSRKTQFPEFSKHCIDGKWNDLNILIFLQIGLSPRQDDFVILNVKNDYSSVLQVEQNLFNRENNCFLILFHAYVCVYDYVSFFKIYLISVDKLQDRVCDQADEGGQEKVSNNHQAPFQRCVSITEVGIYKGKT